MQISIDEFLNEVVTPFHVKEYLRNETPSEMFVSNQELVAVFRPGKSVENGARIIISHSDSPGFKIKPTLEKRDSLTFLPLEVYGSPVISTWLDRELDLAGRICWSENGKIQCSIVKTEKIVGKIMSPALHIDRSINEGKAYNSQTELLICVGEDSSQDFQAFLRKTFSLPGNREYFCDLFAVPHEKSQFWGEDGNIISAYGIDNRSMVFCSNRAFQQSPPSGCTQIFMIFNHEEIGSQSGAGALSQNGINLLKRVFKKINGGYNEFDFIRFCERSFVLSADGAQGYHPLFSDKYDLPHAPRLNKGAAIKYSAGVRYITDAAGAAFIASLASEGSLQKFIMRSDVPSGRTIGPLFSAMTGILAVDIGIPMISMHSIRETAGLKDFESIEKLFIRFYESERAFD